MTPTETEARLRADLAALAACTQVTDRWGDLAAEVDGGPAVVRPDFTSARSSARPPARRLVAVAAALALVVAAGAVAVRVAGSLGQGTTVAPAGLTTLSPRDDGWVIPKALPPGWEVESIDTDFQDVDLSACRSTYVDHPACTTTRWSSASGDRSILVVENAALLSNGRHVTYDQLAAGADYETWLHGTGKDTPRTDIELKGRSASIHEGTTKEVWWNDLTHRTTVIGKGISRAELLAFAGQLVDAAPGSHPSPPGGFLPGPVWSGRTEGSIASIRLVAVKLANPTTHQEIVYDMVPRGFGPGGIEMALATPVRTRGDGTRMLPLDEPSFPASKDAVALQLGRVDVSYGLSETGSTQNTVDAATAAKVLDSLRPVGAAAWADFVDAAHLPGGPAGSDPLKVSGIDDPSLVKHH